VEIRQDKQSQTVEKCWGGPTTRTPSKRCCTCIYTGIQMCRYIRRKFL